MSARSCSFALRVFFKHKTKSFDNLVNSIQRTLLAKVRTDFIQSYIWSFLKQFNKLFSFFCRKHGNSVSTGKRLHSSLCLISTKPSVDGIEMIPESFSNLLGRNS